MKGNITRHPARYFESKNNREVTCQLCPRNCHLTDGKRGVCFVRQNIEGSMILTAYGRSSSFAVDPVEKKPLFHFYPNEPILSFGTAGCNLTCQFCQNWSISKSRAMETLSQHASPEQIVQLAQREGCKMIAFTYNDPVIITEFVVDVAKIAHENNIKTVAVTAGYISAPARNEFFSHMDAANVDLKAFTDRFYQKLASASLQPVLDTLKYIKHETKCWLEITNLVIPKENDDPQEIKEMCEWIVENLGPEVPLHFSAFHPDFKLSHRESTPLSTLESCYEIAQKAGIKYVYLGNVTKQDTATTYCHECQKPVITRDWHHVQENLLKENGACPHCQAICHGHF